MPDPQLSILIPTHRRRELLKQLLGRLRALPGPTREVLVIDDASSDGTRDMLRGFPEVRVLRNEQPRGFDALPQAIALTRGALVFQLDDDAYPADDTLTRVVEHFARRGPRLGLVALPFVEPVSGRTAFTPYLPAPPPGRAHGPANGFLAGAVVLRREAALAIPPSPPGYFLYETEVAAMIEYLAAGWEADYLPDARVFHLWDARRHGVGASAAFLPLRNDIVTIKRYYRGWRRSEMLIGRYLTGFLHLLAAGRPGAWGRALADAERLLATLPAARVEPAVLARVYPCFEGTTLTTLLSRVNARRLGWFLGLLPIDQTS